MFSWNYNSAFEFFILDEDRNRINISSWETLRPKYLPQIAIVEELFTNGSADKTESCYTVIAMEILNLSDTDRGILSLPSEYPYEIYIQSGGQLNQSEFYFKISFMDFAPHGTIFKDVRNGPIFSIDARNYLLTKDQFQACESLESFNLLTQSQKTLRQNFSSFSEIRDLSQDAAVLLDKYLQSQNVVNVQKIKIHIERTHNGLEIIPEVHDGNNSAFIKAFDQFDTVRETYPISNGDGSTTRIILGDGQRSALQNVKRHRVLRDAKLIEQIVENPELFFDQEIVDLSVFYSERVKEIGIYEPKFYPFVSPYKSQWIPGLVVKDRLDGEKRIHFKTLNELNEFEAIKLKAERRSEASVNWRGTSIPMDTATKFISIAKKQFADPTEKAFKQRKPSDMEVLIIKDNAETLEYEELRQSTDDFSHKFISVSNLAVDIRLKNHQVEGIAWLQTLLNQNNRGCLLADDMGLGKTLQLLYFIEWHANFVNKEQKPYLIVAPVALLENWQNEYQKFFKPLSLPVTLLHESVELSRTFDKSQVESLSRKHLILTNYETLRTYQFTLCAINYAVVVLDEAQKIKSPGTQITNVCKALKADFKIAMTGTPVENTLVDLWCIMDFSVPGLLGNAKDFAREFQNPLRQVDVNIAELGERLRNNIGIFIKRRLKSDIASELPKKFDNEGSRIRRKMPALQFARYQNEIAFTQKIEPQGSDRRNQILRALWAVRDISDHPLLVDSQLGSFTTKELIDSSAKIQIIIDILDTARNQREKVIVFADRKETQRMIQRVVFDTYNVFASIINGDTPAAKAREGAAKLSRQQSIDEFQEEEGFNVIIMSPLAAGVGLNVTGANHVIHFSRYWNPAKEDQATDRAYRIGQQRDVHVYYPMAVFPDEFIDSNGVKQKSFDEVIDELLRKKKALASSTLYPTEEAEITPDEMFSDVFGIQASNNLIPLTIQEIDKLHPSLFEAYVAAQYKSMGYNVFLTPSTNDKGVDVVAIKEGSENFLIQAKQSRSLVGNDGVQEIYTAKNYYEKRFPEKFNLLVVSNSDFTSNAEALARANGVTLTKRTSLMTFIGKYPITLQDVLDLDLKRMSRI
jgi:hypothetical protein